MQNGKIDFADKSVTENTRVSYPINHIEKIVRPVSSAPAAKNVIFLSADAFGVLPPVSILTPEQTQYYFLSGFTAKLAGTERGITEPTPTFSACFGQAFLELHPTKYAEELVKKMEKSGAKAYLVNTGWNGTGKRISIKDTRGIIDAILNGDILKAPTKTIPYFNFEVPTELPGVDAGILDPRDTYADASEWENKGKRSGRADSSRTLQNTKEMKQEKLWLPLVLRNKSVQISDSSKNGCEIFHIRFFLSVVYFLLFSFFLPFSSCQSFPSVTFPVSRHPAPYNRTPRALPAKNYVGKSSQKICGCTIGVSRKSTRFCQHPRAVLVKFAGDR